MVEEARMARVDVVVPCYNYGHFLTACVESVLAQEGVEVSVLVVDDGSADQSAAIARALAVRDSRMRLISLPKNIGMIPAVNRGIGEITGEYFVKLDADDLLPPGSLKRSIALLERYPNVGRVISRAPRQDHAGVVRAGLFGRVLNGLHSVVVWALTALVSPKS
jgi:glycosyltransferase involved in cell wall biosynthesis